ncbi:endonuclease domain-containing protein [Actinomadura madurae]|uniref:endonuclease domain-containing protein n=1 Tax=Actinomadura madurae TaxID=1993 RepID=UPI0011BED917|nr:DUF559 domain-containing protein [Actinomadura madurae]
MRSPREVPENLKKRPFRIAEAQSIGVTAKELRSSQYRRIFYDVYVESDLPDSPGLRCEAARLLLPSAAVFCGVTAARLYGVPVPDRDTRIHAAVPSASPTVPRIKDLRVHSYTILPKHLRLWDGWQVVGPERLFLELAATMPRMDLIVAGDHMLRHGLTTRTRLNSFLNKDCYRRRGVRRAKSAMPHLDEKSDSPPETRLRMLIVDAGLPRPIANRDVVTERGVWLARPDLSYPALQIAIQYEGAHHQQDYKQYSYDIERDGRLIEHGWIVIRVNKDGLFGNPRTVLNRIRKAIADRSPA